MTTTGGNRLLICRQTPNAHLLKALSRRQLGCRAQASGRSHWRTGKDFPASCYEHRNQYGEQPLHRKGFGRFFSPWRSGAHKHGPFSRSGDSASKLSTRFSRWFSAFPSPLSMRDGSSLILKRSSIPCCMSRCPLPEKSDLLATVSFSRTRGTAHTSNRTSALLAYPLLLFSHKKDR